MSKERIVELLLGTERPGMDKLIQHMEEIGFFTSPCSTQHHLSKEGGLAKHSLNVYMIARDTRVCFGIGTVDYNAMVIATLLHDLGKAGQFGKSGYIENILKSGKRSDSKPYATNGELLPVDHEIRSIQIASKFIDLTEEESHAILYHNGMYGSLKYQLQGNETPLQILVHWADMWASRVMEKEEGAQDE